MKTSLILIFNDEKGYFGTQYFYKQYSQYTIFAGI